MGNYLAHANAVTVKSTDDVLGGRFRVTTCSMQGWRATMEDEHLVHEFAAGAKPGAKAVAAGGGEAGGGGGGAATDVTTGGDDADVAASDVAASDVAASDVAASGAAVGGAAAASGAAPALLVAVFDGHGGTQVSKFATLNFAPLLLQNPSFRRGDYAAAIRETFLALDARIAGSPEAVKQLEILASTYNIQGVTHPNPNDLPEMKAARKGVSYAAGAAGDAAKAAGGDDRGARAAPSPAGGGGSGGASPAKAGGGAGGGGASPGASAAWSPAHSAMAREGSPVSGRSALGAVPPPPPPPPAAKAAGGAGGGGEPGGAGGASPAAGTPSPGLISSFFSRLARVFRPGGGAVGGGLRTPAPSSAEHPACFAGSTAVAAFIVGDRIIAANTGDSRCVLCRGETALELTRDHKPYLMEEKKRILAAGGWVDMGRVNGNLNLSRALGDLNYKCHAGLPPEKQVITAAPEILALELDPARDDFLLLGCDGIWEARSSQEVVDFLRQRLAAGASAEDALEDLFQDLVSPNPSLVEFGCDNMTAVLVDLRPQSRVRLPSVRRLAPPVTDAPAPTFSSPSFWARHDKSPYSDSTPGKDACRPGAPDESVTWETMVAAAAAGGAATATAAPAAGAAGGGATPGSAGGGSAASPRAAGAGRANRSRASSSSSSHGGRRDSGSRGGSRGGSNFRDSGSGDSDSLSTGEAAPPAMTLERHPFG